VSGSLPQLQKGGTGATQQQPGQGSEPDPVIPLNEIRISTFPLGHRISECGPNRADK